MAKEGVAFLLLKFAIQEFLEDRKFKNLTEITVKGYERSLKAFHDYIVSEHQILNIEDVRPYHIKAYLSYRKKELKNNAETINHEIRNLKAFFNYFVKEKVISVNPVTVPIQKTDTKIETFTDYHIRQMLRYYRKQKQRGDNFYAYRGYIMILILLGTGIRLGEMCNLKWKDVDFVNAKMTVIGKGRRQRTIPLTDNLKKELMEWRFYVEKKLGNVTEDSFVIPTQTGKRLNENSVKTFFQRLKKIMNFRDVRLSPHTFRHTFAKQWILSGGDVFSLQRILGHSTIEVTNKYVNLFGSALKEQNDKFNPLNNMDL